MRARTARLMVSVGVVALMPLSILAADQQSGITGQVLIYICPVVLPGSNCYDPYQTSITIVRQNGRFVTEVTTDEQGRFTVDLRPGHYVLIPAGSGNGTLPLVEEMTVRVTNKHFTPVTIVYDSGIR